MSRARKSSPPFDVKFVGSHHRYLVRAVSLDELIFAYVPHCVLDRIFREAEAAFTHGYWTGIQLRQDLLWFTFADARLKPNPKYEEHDELSPALEAALASPKRLTTPHRPKGGWGRQ